MSDTTISRIDRSPTARIMSHPDDLGALSVLPLPKPHPRGRIRIVDERLDDKRRSNWEGRLNRAYHACGCGEAALGLVVGLLGGGIWIATNALAGARIEWTDGLWVLVAAVIGDLFGKLAGLYRAEVRLRRLTHEIAHEWQAPPRAYGDSRCG